MAYQTMAEAPRQATMARVAPPEDVAQFLSVDLSSPWHPEDDILEGFAFDDEKTWRFFSYLQKMQLICFPPGWLMCPFISCNEADRAYARWVAVSRDNIMLVRKQHKAACRLYCCDVGETRKVIPIMNVQDVMIKEPAGTAFCCCVPRVLTEVLIQTAASHSAEKSNSDASMMVLSGLMDPKRFRDVVLSLKRGRYTGPDGTVRLTGGTAPASGAGLSASTPALSAGADLAETNALLADLLTVVRGMDNKFATDLLGRLKSMEDKLTTATPEERAPLAAAH